MNKKILFTILALNIIIVSLGAWGLIQKPKYAYVDLGALYENFKLKKELESKRDNIVSKRKLVVDSLELCLKDLAYRLNNNVNITSALQKDTLAFHFERMKQEYHSKKQVFDEDNERTKSDYSAQIWKQLNQYVKDYGAQQGYDYIFGADGSGSLMYASEAENITASVKMYLDEKYTGNAN